MILPPPRETAPEPDANSAMNTITLSAIRA